MFFLPVVFMYTWVVRLGRCVEGDWDFVVCGWMVVLGAVCFFASNSTPSDWYFPAGDRTVLL